MNAKLIGVLVGVVAAGAALWWLLAPGDEQRIQRELDALVANVEKSGPESPLAAVGKATEVADRFVEEPDLQVDVLPGSAPTREAVQSSVFQIRAMADSISLHLYDRALELAPDRRSAHMRLSVRATGRAGGDSDRVIREFELRWIKADGRWRIQSARTVEAIRRVQ